MHVFLTASASGNVGCSDLLELILRDRQREINARRSCIVLQRAVVGRVNIDSDVIMLCSPCRIG